MSGGLQQYCLKWNNHPSNISGVFERLRSSEQFTDITLAAADHKSIKCHRILLCAGSGYLEELLSHNPSEHPIVVLSQICHRELQLLVEFMYSGEVAVEQERLAKLLEAARALKIKGLYESEDDVSEEETAITSQSELRRDSIRQSLDSYLGQQQQQHQQEAPPSSGSEEPSIPSPEPPQLTISPLTASPKSVIQKSGSQRRKRKLSKVHRETLKDDVTQSGPQQEKQIKLPPLPITPLASLPTPIPPPTAVQAPATNATLDQILGINNTCFFGNIGQMSNPQPANNPLSDLPKLLPASAEPQLPMPDFLTQLAHATLTKAPSPPTTAVAPPRQASTGSVSPALSSAGSVESNGVVSNQIASAGKSSKYKNYTEQDLQAALKEILDGQSINRSSQKYHIPPRTLRDWMKRLNIKSVFTHNNNSGPNKSASKGDSESAKENANLTNATMKKTNSRKSIDLAKFDLKPVIATEATIGAKSVNSEQRLDRKVPNEAEDDDDDEEEEIDDDEERSLQIDEQLKA